MKFTLEYRTADDIGRVTIDAAEPEPADLFGSATAWEDMEHIIVSIY